MDPITFGVVRGGLQSAAREMYRVFKRTTMLAIIYEFNDFGMSLFDDRLNMVADAPGIPIFLGSLDGCIEKTLEELGGAEQLRPGDTLFNNHPYLTAGQPPDAAVMQPIFHGDRLIGYAAIRAHMGDFGGKGWYPTDTTELFQEGTLFPGVKIYEEGVRVDALFRIMAANSRLPRETVGSIMGAVAAAQACARKVVSIVDKYGIDTYYEVIDAALDHGERLARNAIERIPDGTYSYADQLDNNGVDSDPVELACEVRVKGSDIEVDVSGSAAQQRGPVNCPWGYTLTTSRFALKRLTTPDSNATSGEYRPLKVIAPEGSVFNPASPAPCFIGAWTSLRLSDMIVQALAPAMPDRVPAESGGDLAVCSVRVRDVANRRWHIFADFGALGMGAAPYRDGMNALIHPIEAGCQSLPAELVEARMPLYRRRWELQSDSGGAGKYRGGLGAVSEWEFLSHGVINAITEKTRGSAPRGLAGGGSAPFMNELRVFPDTEQELRLGKKSNIETRPGDVFSMRAAGGGGHGDPFERDPARVLADVVDGYVSVENARELYGVVIDLEREAVDTAATDALRATRSA